MCSPLSLCSSPFRLLKSPNYLNTPSPTPPTTNLNLNLNLNGVILLDLNDLGDLRLLRLWGGGRIVMGATLPHVRRERFLRRLRQLNGGAAVVGDVESDLLLFLGNAEEAELVQRPEERGREANCPADDEDYSDELRGSAAKS